LDVGYEIFDISVLDHTPGLQVEPGIEGWIHTARSFRPEQATT
jgi:hypothetical protein